MLKTKAQSIIIEDLNVKGMLQNPKLAKGIQEERLHEFKRILTYKCKRLRINLVVANRWFPSSKLCNVCGYKNVDLSLKIRWTCPICKTRHDRDENAAINLEKGTVNSNFMLLYILKDGEIKQCMNGIN